MYVNVNFTLNIDPTKWEGRNTPTATPVDPHDPDVVDRVAKEVRAHAEYVVRSLFSDMGWTAESANA